MASPRASLLADLQECQRNLDCLRDEHASSCRSSEQVERSIRALEEKTTRTEREDARLESNMAMRRMLANICCHSSADVERGEAEETGLKRALQALPPDVVVVLFTCVDTSPSTPTVSVPMARNISKQEFEAKFFERARDIIPGTVSFAHSGVPITTDTDLQIMMRDIKSAPIAVTYDTGRKPYPLWTEHEVCAKRIYDDFRPLPDHMAHHEGTAVLPPIALAQQKALCEELKRYAHKLGRPKVGFGLVEAVRRVFITAFLLRVAECFEGVFLGMELSLVGSLGTGTLDYAIHYLRSWIVVTEAKRDDYAKAVAQNLIGMRSAFEDSRRKRKKALPVYGVVSDGSIWLFLCLHDDGRTYSQSKAFMVTYTVTREDPSATMVEGAKVVFKHLYNIVEAQVKLLQDEEGTQPAAKRQRLDLNPDTVVVALYTEH